MVTAETHIKILAIAYTILSLFELSSGENIEKKLAKKTYKNLYRPIRPSFPW
jgi:hypothetical protein